MSQWGTSWGRAASWKPRGAHQTPPQPRCGVGGEALLPPLPGCTFKMEGPQTPSSGPAVATAQRQPSRPRASAECSKNSLPARAANTEAADWVWMCSGVVPGSERESPVPLCAHWHSGGCPGQAATSPFWRGHCSPRIPGKEGEGRLGGHVTKLKCPFRSAPSISLPGIIMPADCCSERSSQRAH